MILYFLNNRGHMQPADLLFLFATYAIIILLVLPFHELAHAYVAHKCGDDTAKWHGRLSLNPLAHLDLWGTLAIVVVGIGYAKPVPIVPRNFRHYKRDTILVALAGPVSNLLMAIAAGGLFKLATLFIHDIVVLNVLWMIANILMSVNVGLAVFNLLPIPPLDGSRLWTTLLPGKWSYTLERYSREITGVLFVLLLVGVLDKPLNFLSTVFLYGIRALFRF